MYLIKRLGYDRLYDLKIVEDGITVGVLNKKDIEIVPGYWGESKLIASDDFISNAVNNAKNKIFKLEYADAYETKQGEDGFIELTLIVKSPEECSKEIEGYIIFFNQTGANVSSNGEELFRRYYYERIVVLREGQYFNYYNKTAKVVDGELTIIDY